MNPLAILSAVGGLGGLFGGGGGMSSEAKAAAADAAINTGMQRDAYAQYQAAIADAVRQGLFDPEQTVAQMAADSARTQGTTLKNLGGGLAAAGYRPGDSAITREMDASNERTAAQLAAGQLAARQGTLNAMLQAYQGLNAGSASLNAGIQNAQYQQQLALQQQQAQQAQTSGGINALLGAAMPYLASKSAIPKTQTAISPTTYGIGGGSGMFAATPQLGGGSGMFGNLNQGFGGAKAFNGFSFGGGQ